MMVDEPHLDRLAQAVADGLLAEEVVFATSRAIRHEALDADDRRALAEGRDLLRLLAEPHPAFARGGYFDQLATGERALETLRIARSAAPTEDVQSFLTGLVTVLDEALTNQPHEENLDELETVRTLFLNLGRFTLARANNLARSPEDRLPWLTSTGTTPSSSPRRIDQSSNS